MDIIQDMQVHTLTYWAPLGADEYGKQRFDDPVEMTCRWDDVSEEFIDADGIKQISRAKVYPELDVLPGGVLWKGEITNLQDTARPLGNEGALVIKRLDKIDTIEGDDTLRIAIG